MADGMFSVDVRALTDAGLGVSDLMAELHTRKVEDIDCPAAAVGHDALAGTMSDFCNRWQTGVANLTSDGKELATRLIDSAGAYLAAEQDSSQALQQAGSGPGAASAAGGGGRG